MEIDNDLIAGARNAVRVCMNIGAADRVFILTDDETLPVAEALAGAARETGAEVTSACIEEFGARPMTALPDGLLEQVSAFAPTVTFFAASARPGELPMRGGFVGLARGKFNVRHAHMPTITARLMREGMLADYQQIHDVTLRVFERVKNAKTIRVTSADGTDLTAHFRPDPKWIPCHGLYHEQGSGGNLPEGEVYTSPASVEGTFVTRVLGDYFSPKYGLLSEPVRIRIADGRLEQASSPLREIAAELEAYLDSAENGRRVGEFAIGTNLAVKSVSGTLLQDEKIPGVHIAFGDPLGHSTGADWSSAVHVDVVCPGCTVEVDGEVLMQDGKFLLLE